MIYVHSLNILNSRLINGELQVGNVKEKEAAKQEYERAKAGGFTAGLVEQK